MRSDRFFVDPYCQIPPHWQLCHQIKLARFELSLAPGDALPSIRALARRTGVGDGVVRRAYRELCTLGLLHTDRRRHVIAASALPTTPEADALARGGAAQIGRLMAWASGARVSAMGLGRFLLMRGLAQEAISPSYVFVDVCQMAATESAHRIAKAWGIKVTGISQSDFVTFPRTELLRLSTVLVNEHLHEDVRRMVGEGTPRVLAVKMRVDKHIRQRIERLPARARALLITSDDSSSPGDRALLRYCQRLLGSRRRLDAEASGDRPDLSTLVKVGRYGLVLISPVVWERTPAKIRRMTSVVRIATEPDLPSLEAVRISAGVLA